MKSNDVDLENIGKLLKIYIGLGPAGTTTAPVFGFNAHALARIWDTDTLREYFIEKGRLAEIWDSVCDSDTDESLIPLITIKNVVATPPDPTLGESWSVRNPPPKTDPPILYWWELMEANRALFVSALAKAIIALRDIDRKNASVRRVRNRVTAIAFPLRAAWLKSRLAEKRWTVQDFARESGIDGRTLQKILDGKRVVENTLDKLENFFKQRPPTA
jgi:hypothetical protein